MSRQHEFVQQILTLESDRLDNFLKDNISCVNNNLLSLINEKEKTYKKPYCVDWAKLQIALASIHLNYGERISYEDTKINIREEGVSYCNDALNIYQREKCDREIAICQTYLDIAYDKFVYNLRQYTGIVPEKESVIKTIEQNSIAAAYFSPDDEYTPSDVVVEVIINAAKFSKDNKPSSLREKRKWIKANNHLYKIVEALNIYGRYNEKYNCTLGEALSRNSLISLTPQPSSSISRSLKLFLTYKKRISFLDKDEIREIGQEIKHNQGKPIQSLDEDKFDDDRKLIDIINSNEPTPWEKLIDRDRNRLHKSLAYHTHKYLEIDPEGRLKKEHPEGYPQANCQAIFYRKFINPPGDTLKVLAEEWGIPEGTLNSYYARGNYHKLLQEIVIEEELKYNLSPKASEYIRQDRSNNLKKCRLKKYPQCNCQALAINRLLNETPTRIEVLAEQLKISEKSLVKHWRNNCLPLLQSIINNGEYL